MNAIADHYDVYYADKLWNLLPAVYRSEDSSQFGANGPLREMVNRIGAQAALLRRSIDRIWEDQSIETCDDWVIPYIGDLVATNLVANLDARGQRLDVANTIAYRLRKGTLAIIEEIAARITGWDAKAVEFFRRLGRTRHGLDPAIGRAAGPSDPPTKLQYAEGLLGRLTRTPIGGFADLRDVYGATKAHSPFDEFFHTQDVRPGQGRFGWYDIPRLGIFVWRLESFPVGPVTPVPVQGCPGWYAFDPTGRDIPLFAAPRKADVFRDNWVSPVEGQLAAPMTQSLLDSDIMSQQTSSFGLYPNALSVSPDVAPGDVLDASELLIRPERGRFQYIGSPPDGPFVASYHYGFPSEIGAGPFDRRIGTIPIDTPAPPAEVRGGGAVLSSAVAPSGTLSIQDSLTYEGIADVTIAGELTLKAGEFQRPLIRLPDAVVPWRITGTSGCCLNLDGMLLSGGDVVLQGSFGSVTLSCCTLDPGLAAPTVPLAEAGLMQSPAPALFAIAADGRDLSPTRVWIEGSVTTMTIDRCVTGPIRTRNRGVVETLSISNSIVQGIRTSGFGPIELPDVKDAMRFERRIQLALDPVSAMLQYLEPQIGALLGSGASPPTADPPPSPADLQALLALIDSIVAGQSIFDPSTFAGVPLSAATRAFLMMGLSPPVAGPELNRSLLEDAYPLELADAALAFADGTMNLSRCTVLGRIVAHRLQASECILQGLTQVDDTQDGCIRFSAWAQGSILPRQFESVQVTEDAPLFTAVDFGQPGYAQLLPLVDLGIVRPTGPSQAPQNSISTGAQDGSEMGAYARDKNPIKAEALVIKLQEFMPAGLVPVVVMET